MDEKVTRAEMEQYIESVLCGRYGAAEDIFKPLTDRQLRNVFMAAYKWAMNNPETPPAGTMRADLFAMDKMRHYHQ